MEWAWSLKFDKIEFYVGCCRVEKFDLGWRSNKYLWKAIDLLLQMQINLDFILVLLNYIKWKNI